MAAYTKLQSVKILQYINEQCNTQTTLVNIYCTIHRPHVAKFVNK